MNGGSMADIRDGHTGARGVFARRLRAVAAATAALLSQAPVPAQADDPLKSFVEQAKAQRAIAQPNAEMKPDAPPPLILKPAVENAAVELGHRSHSSHRS